VQTSPGKIHGTDTYDLPTLGWVSALGHLRGEILQEGAANTGAFLRYVQATDRLPMLDDVVEYSEKDQKGASTNLAIRLSQTHFIAGNIAFFRLLWRVLAQNAARSIGPVAEVN
jgi:hypothetical protein